MCTYRRPFHPSSVAVSHRSIVPVLLTWREIAAVLAERHQALISASRVQVICESAERKLFEGVLGRRESRSAPGRRAIPEHDLVLRVRIDHVQCHLRV